MATITEEDSRALDAASDLKDLLRLAHEALHRIEQDVHGGCYDSADELSRKLHDVRKEADELSDKIAVYVKEVESGT